MSGHNNGHHQAQEGRPGCQAGQALDEDPEETPAAKLEAAISTPIPACASPWTGPAANMPKDNFERAIKKGTGELEGVPTRK